MRRITTWACLTVASMALLSGTAHAADPSLAERHWDTIDALLADVVPDARLAPDSGLGVDGRWGDELGAAVAASGDTLLVGAPHDAIGRLVDRGSVYLFVHDATGWRLDRKLLAPDGAAGDRFGASVAIDGDIALVGAPAADLGTDTDRGTAHVFVRTATGWSWQARLDGAGGARSDRFGTAVAVSGDTALVGAPGVAANGNDGYGAAWAFRRGGGAWTEEARLAAADGAGSDSFGLAVALSGDRALIGAPSHGAAGAGYVFERSGSTWAAQAQLVPAGASPAANAGSSVALAGDTAILGAPLDHVGENAWQGRAFVFARGATQWSQEAVLVAMAGTGAEHYGAAVAASGDLVAVGRPGATVGMFVARGSVDVWRRTAGTWGLAQRIDPVIDSASAFGSALAFAGSRLLVGAPYGHGGRSVSGGASVYEGVDVAPGPPSLLLAGEAVASFGTTVAVDGDTLVIGVPFERILDPGTMGAAYVYQRAGGQWSLAQRLVAPATSFDARFGAAVAIDGDTIVVGEPAAAMANFSGGNPAQGNAWVFVRQGSQWNIQGWLFSGGGEALDFFGASVAVDGDTVTIGIPGARPGDDSQQGAVEVFKRSGSTWDVQARLVPAENSPLQQFGRAVVLDGDRLVVGSLGGESAWVFERNMVGWTQVARLAPAPSAVGNFGWSLALSGDRLLVGAPFRSIGGVAARGAVDVFELNGPDWVQRAQLMAPDGSAQDRFGASIAQAGDTILVGNWPDTGGVPRDAAYVFEHRGHGWRLDARWRPHDADAREAFGSAVALAGSTAVVGAPGASGPAPWGNPAEGAAWVYTHRADLLFFDDMEPDVAARGVP